MQVSQFSCPHCRASLKVRSGAFIGREIDCPDCGVRLQLLADSGAGLRVELTGDVESASGEEGPLSGAASSRRRIDWNAWKMQLSKKGRWLGTSLGLAWLGAAISVLILFVVVIQRVGSSQEQHVGGRDKQQQLVDGSGKQQHEIKPDEVDSNSNTSNKKKNDSNSKTPNPNRPAEKNDPTKPPTDTPVSKNPSENPVESSAVEAMRPLEAARPVVDTDIAGDEESKKIDVQETLAQKIPLYEPTGVRKLRDLMRGVEEMVAVPIRIDETQREEITRMLERSVIIQKQQKTTVKQILDVLVKKAGLSYEVTSDAIWLRRASFGTQEKDL